MPEYTKPLPVIDRWNEPFWKGCRERKLVLQRCSDCGTYRFPPSAGCRRCLAEAHSWEECSGRGTIWSFAIFHQLYYPGFAGEIPYNVIMVELDEGPVLMSNLVGAPNAEIATRAPVEAVYEDVTPEVTLLKFRPAARGRPS